MLDIIMDADNEIYEENLLIISDAYEVRTDLKLFSMLHPSDFSHPLTIFGLNCIELDQNQQPHRLFKITLELENYHCNRGITISGIVCTYRVTLVVVYKLLIQGRLLFI